MKRRGKCWRYQWLMVICFLAFASSVEAQDLFREIQQLKTEVAGLKQELGDLRSLVFELRRAMLESADKLDRNTKEKVPPKEQTVAKQPPQPDEQQLTKIICKAVGRFFADADIALRTSDTSVATEEMKKALHKLNTSVHGYSGTHRVSKLLDIYEGLAWSTYTAVQLRQSVAGNEDFIKVLNKHRQRYIDTCPKQ
jgi:hypothetical protein